MPPYMRSRQTLGHPNHPRIQKQHTTITRLIQLDPAPPTPPPEEEPTAPGPPETGPPATRPLGRIVLRPVGFTPKNGDHSLDEDTLTQSAEQIRKDLGRSRDSTGWAVTQE